MFALRRNTFFNYRTCSLRVDIEQTITIEAFASLRFDTLALSALHYSIQGSLCCFWTCLHYRGLCCSWRSLQSTPQGPELHLDVSALQEPVLLLEVSTVYTTGAWAASGRVCTTEACVLPEMLPQRPELHLNVSALQRHVLLLEVSTTEAWTASVCVCTTEACAAPGGVYTAGSWAASELVCITEACTAPGGVYTTGA